MIYKYAVCSALTSVSIPSSVTSIGVFAFGNCWALSDVYCYGENVPISASDMFDASPIASATLYVPAGSVDMYLAASPWNSFGNIVALPTEINPTGVSRPTPYPYGGEMFDLQGRKINSKPAKGIYIEDGKKKATLK